MHSSPSARLRVAAWLVTLFLPLAAWQFSTLFSAHFGVGVFFTVAAVLSAAIGGLLPSLIAALLNTTALNGFYYLHHPADPHGNNILWSFLIIAVTLMVGYAREKWSAAEMLAGHLSTDLARLRDELDSQRTDLKRFHELSVSLSSSLERQHLLNDVLTAIAGLQKTDLAMLLLLPHPASKILKVETYAGFTAEQIALFGQFPASFFSTQRRTLIEDIETPGTYFPFMDAAEQVGFRAMFSAPIINSHGDPLGVVVTFFRQPHSPTDRQSKLVELYARQAANALDNASLYHNSLETLAAEQHRTAVVRSLADASLQINSVLSLDSLLQTITDQARKIIGARQAFTTLLPKGDWRQSLTCTSAADTQTTVQFPPERSEMFMLACNLNKPVRITAGAQANQPWQSIMKGAAPRDGWLAAPLLTRDGRNLGLIQLYGKMNGEFSEDDEAILVQLTHMASVAIDNVRLYREAQEQIEQTKRTQEALERSKESMQLAQRCVGIGIWEWDLQSGALFWSEEICRLHGLAPEQFDRHYESWMQSIHPEDRQQVHSSIAHAVSSSSEYQVQYRVIFPDKSVHWLEARGQAVVIGSTPMRMLGVAMDVTSRKLAEEALRRSEKLAATGRLAASIAHEINNPLEAVTNVLYILRSSPELDQRSHNLVETAEGELNRVVHITKQTLAFYRDVTSPVAISVPNLLEDVLSAYSRKIEEKAVTIHKEYGPVNDVRAFPGELRQVFSNLVLNALEAVSNAGAINIRIRESKDAKGKSGIRVTVADNGPGIGKQNLPRIFEPFFTTKESKGTGLGLWVSHGIVHKHGGTIRVRSSVDAAHHGTSFVVFLPAESLESMEVPNELQVTEENVSELMTKGSAAGSGDLVA
jgi:PAS domain S-box-containing protein